MVQLYWLAQVANDLYISTVHYLELGEMLTPKNNHIGRRNIEFTFSQVATSECMYGTRNSFKKFWVHFNFEIYFLVHVFYTCKLVKCHHAAFHHGMHCLLG